MDRNKIIARLMVFFGLVIFYSGGYRYKWSGNKVPWKYRFYIEDFLLPRKRKYQGRVIDYWLHDK